VNVWVRGTTASVKNLKPQEISAWVDLQNAKAGERHFELTPSNVNVPYGFSVLRISPSRVNLRIEQVTTRRVPVIPRLHGEPPEGYAVMESTVTPSQVEITGPQSAVSAVRSVITDSIDVSTIKGSHVERVNIGVEKNACWRRYLTIRYRQFSS
jgi:YbbR domain-containing protein